MAHDSRPETLAHAEYACKAEPERQTLRKHLREHGRATPAHVWASRCRWCRLGSWWYDRRHRDWRDDA